LGCTDEDAGFSRGARRFVDENGVEPIDGEALLGLPKESNLGPLRLGRKPGNEWPLRESPRCGWSHRFDETRSYAHRAQAVFNGEKCRIEPTDTHASVTTDEVREARLNPRLD